MASACATGSAASHKGSADFDEDFLRRIYELLRIKRGQSDSRTLQQSVASPVCNKTSPSSSTLSADIKPLHLATPQSELCKHHATSNELSLLLPERKPMSTNPPASNRDANPFLSVGQHCSGGLVALDTRSLKCASRPQDTKKPAIRAMRCPAEGRRYLPWLDGTRQSSRRASNFQSSRLPGSFNDDPVDEYLLSSSNPAASADTTHSNNRMAMIENQDESCTEASTQPLTMAHSNDVILDRSSKIADPTAFPNHMRFPGSAVQENINEVQDSRPAVPVALAARSNIAGTEMLPSHILGRDSALSDQGTFQATSRTLPNTEIGDVKNLTPSSDRQGDTSGGERTSETALKDSVVALESLMQEAVRLATDAAEIGRTDELPGILENAKVAIRHASALSVHQKMAAGLETLHEHETSVPHYMVPCRDEDDSSTFSSDSSMSLPSPTIPPMVQHMSSAQDVPDGQCSHVRLPQRAKLDPEPAAHDWAYREGRPYSPISDYGIDDNSPTSRRIPREDGLSEDVLSGNQRRPRFEGNDSESSENHSPVTRIFGTVSSSGVGRNWGRDKYEEKDYVGSDALKGRHHYTLADHQHFSIHHHRRQPIARNWSPKRKRFTAFVACLNTSLIGTLVGIYAGEVPAIQYALTDTRHMAILGNSVLYLGMAISTLLTWSLPLLHGRKPYTVLGLALTLPLQFPQAVMVMQQRDPNDSAFRTALLVSRALQGLAMGMIHINTKSVLLDLYGASLQSEHPHGELVILDDVRRHGGGIGLWLGWWSFCFIGSLSVGFLIGAGIVNGVNVSWGFYVSVILIAVVLLLNVLTPETRRAPHRRTLAEVQLANMNVARRVARGEIRVHVWGDGPKYWWEEVSAAIYLSLRMLEQVGFSLMAMYLAWIYGQVILIIVLLGNLLSVGYRWAPQYVGLGVLSIAVGAFLAIPDTKANMFSRARSNPARTDSMTFQPRVTWSSHLVRRTAFMVLLPLAGMAYTLSSGGVKGDTHYMAPILFAGLIGYLTVLAIAECHGIIMETYDTCDLQPGVNSRHRLQSLTPAVRKRRTTYSSYPRVSAGLFAAQTMGFLMAAVATAVGGILTRAVGAQHATGIVAGILFGLTLLLTASLWRYKAVQVIPNELFGANFGGTQGSGEKRHSMVSMQSDRSWRAVVIGNPSGKFRRMSMLELGGLSRWTEIRRLNRLLNRTSTQPLTEGWR